MNQPKQYLINIIKLLTLALVVMTTLATIGLSILYTVSVKEIREAREHCNMWCERE